MKPIETIEEMQIIITIIIITIIIIYEGIPVM